MAVPRTIVVATNAELETLIVRYVSTGFVATNRTSTEVVLIKKKEFSIPMLIIGLLLCVIPLILYLIVYALQQDQIVILRLVTSTSLAADSGPASPTVEQLEWSDDRTRWRKGTEWVDVASEIPPACPLSDDKRQWWDGMAWRVVQPGARHPNLSGR